MELTEIIEVDTVLERLKEIRETIIEGITEESLRLEKDRLEIIEMTEELIETTEEVSETIEEISGMIEGISEMKEEMRILLSDRLEEIDQAIFQEIGLREIKLLMIGQIIKEHLISLMILLIMGI